MSLPLHEKIKLLNQTILESLTTVTSGQNIIRAFTDTGIKVLGADFGFVWFKGYGKKKFQLAYSSPSTPYLPESPRKTGITLKMFRKKAPFFVSNLHDTKTIRSSAKSHMVSLAAIPITYRKHTYGVIYLCFKAPRNFSEEEQGLCAFLGNSTAQAITIHRLHLHVEEQYKSLLQQKDEFISIASHELKTPLTTIKGYTQLLKRKFEKLQDYESVNYLTKIEAGGIKLMTLINDLLNATKMRERKFELVKETFYFDDLVNEIVDDLKSFSEIHRITKEGETGRKIYGDRNYLGQVLINLITNAIKYSPNSDHVIVRISDNDHSVKVNVEDFGVGIPSDKLAKVFDPYYQAGDASREGLGLGLYISSEIVKAHGGKIWVESLAHAGTNFFFSVPLGRTTPGQRVLKFNTPELKYVQKDINRGR